MRKRTHCKTNKLSTTDKITERALNLLERDVNVRDATVTELGKAKMYGNRIKQLEKEVRVLTAMVTQMAKRIKPLEEERFMNLATNWDILTPPQIVVLQYVAAGMSNKEIAKRIKRSPDTVRTHIFNASRRLGVNSRSEVIAECYKRGIFIRAEKMNKSK